MSQALLNARGEYLHSPVNNLESFFWVALWSVVSNMKAKYSLVAEKQLSAALLRNNKSHAMEIFTELHVDKQCNHIILCFQCIIEDWWKKVQDQHLDLLEALDPLPANTDNKHYLPHFHWFALQGVFDVFEVLENHWNSEISWMSWTAPM